MGKFKWIIGISVGAALGFAYWYFIGCDAGTCAITSSPVNSTIYGSLMGVLLINWVFANKKKEVR